MELPDYLPISMLNAFEYCPRRFWIEFVQGEMEVNAHVLEGQLKHERAHAVGIEHAGEDLKLRRLYVYSDALRVAGFADVVEIENGIVVPIEYKKGAMGKWLNDHMQLCAQAMCLEERLKGGDWRLETGRGVSELQSFSFDIQYGFLFYFGSRRRERVEFDETLRGKTRACVDEMWELLRREVMPAPIEKFAKCRECSLERICLPREVRQLVSESDSRQSSVISHQ